MLPPSSVIAGRFEIESLAGTGGMGSVYRACDRQSGELVALKILHSASAEGLERFDREACLLAELVHPGIVRYVAHGVTEAGERWLAMEWLEGETLADRMERQGFTIQETMRLIGQITAALAFAHERAVVHRDLKPGNLFLSGGSIEHLKLIDFGIARQTNAAKELTMTGAMLGTPSYMAPEQARGERRVDARADVYALGCVLFKCLTGRTPFVGDDVLSVLLKVVMEEPPKPSELNEEVPAELDGLVMAMLAKVPDERPKDAGAVLAVLALVGQMPAGREAPVSVHAPALTTSERRMLCLVLARTWNETSDSEATMLMSQSKLRDNELSRILTQHRGKLDVLADGTMSVTIAGSGSATDLAVRAAHCSLAIRRLWPNAPVALVSGRAVLMQRSPVGELITRGAQMLASADISCVHIDEVTAALLGDRFDVSELDVVCEQAPVFALKGERANDGETRTLLGKPTSCEGREQELSMLESSVVSCVDEPMARAALVTGVAGVGKSRIRHELLQRLHKRAIPFEVWRGQGDPMSAGAPFSMIASALKPRLGLSHGEPLEERRRKLLSHMEKHFWDAELARVTEFLGEMLGIPFPDDQSVMLRAARRDPVLMGDQMCRAWEDFVAAECAVQPVVLVLEDLHWGDLPSVQFVDAALRNLRDQPLFVLALARPEVRTVFPKLWEDHNVQEIRLGALSKKACEKLVRQVLGDRLGPARLSQIIDQAAGNAFFLEELIRAVSEGHADELPESVFAIVQSRLEGLGVEERRLLRAASVFGQSFWERGIYSLLGAAESTAYIGERLKELCARELVVKQRKSQLAGEIEYTFRHALVRDAAYAMLTDSDRALGHRLAGDWLERIGEVSGVTLAEHFERGGQPLRAVVHYIRAAEQALEGNDLGAAIARAEQAIVCGAAGEHLGTLNLLLAEAHAWRDNNDKARSCAREAMKYLSKGGPVWMSAAGELSVASARSGDYDTLLFYADEIENIIRGIDVPGPHAIAAARVAIQLLFAGKLDAADTLLKELSRGAAQTAERDPAVAGWVHQASAWRSLFAGDPAAYLGYCEAAFAFFNAAGAERNASTSAVNIGYACMQMGAFEQSERYFKDAIALASRLGIGTAVGEHNLGLSLAYLGRYGEAFAMERAALASFEKRGDGRLVGGARVYLALIMAMQGGDLEQAEREAAMAMEAGKRSPPIYVYALGVRAWVRFKLAKFSEAKSDADEAMQLLAKLGGIDEGDAFIRLTHALVLSAMGSKQDALKAVLAAKARLLERAAKIADLNWRDSFLKNVPENAQTIGLAKQWSANSPD